MIKVGQTVEFDPFDCITGYGIELVRRNVAGKVVFVNAQHLWFAVACDECNYWISFHFCEIGEKVRLCNGPSK